MDYNTTTGVLEKAEVVRALDSGSGRVDLRDIQADEKKLRDKWLEEDADAGPAPGLTTSLAPILTGLTAIVGGLGLRVEPSIIKDERLLWAAVACFTLAFILSLAGQFLKKTVSVKPGRLDLLNEQAKPTFLKRAVPVTFFVLVFVGILFAAGSVFIGGKDEPTKAVIGDPVTTVTTTGRAVSLTVTWTGMNEDAKKVRTTVVTLPERQEVYRQEADKSDEGGVAQEVKFTLNQPTTIQVTTEALDTSGETLGEKSVREFQVP